MRGLICCGPLPINAVTPQTAGLESLQENLQVPNHRIPLSAVGVREALSAGRAVQQLLATPPDHHQQPSDQPQPHTCSSSGTSSTSSQASTAPEGRLFLYTSPFLRCIQTAQHVARALHDDQVSCPLSHRPCLDSAADAVKAICKLLFELKLGGKTQPLVAPIRSVPHTTRANSVQPA